MNAPASKSAMQRACAAALVAGGMTVIHNPGHSNDDQAAMDIISKLGASVKKVGDNIVVNSDGVRPVAGTINCGESGLSIRMFTPLAALSKQRISITGSGSLASRPMDFFDEVMPLLGVQVSTQGGRLPMAVQGPVVPADIRVDGSLSSQFLTGLLMAYSAAGAQNVTISVTNLKSRPYIDLTLRLMERFGMKMPANQAYQAFYFDDALHLPFSGEREYTVEGDWSGGAFLLVAGAIAGNITVTGLDLFSAQADKAVLQALVDAGADMTVKDNRIDVKAGPLAAFRFDATDCPDLFPPLVALAACCTGTSVITGTSRLTHKESNRALTLQEEFSKMGVAVRLDGDEMRVAGSAGTILGGEVHSRHDHRIAMACAVAGLRAAGELRITGAEAVDKSYPDFYTHLMQLGANVYTEIS